MNVIFNYLKIFFLFICLAGFNPLVIRADFNSGNLHDFIKTPDGAYNSNADKAKNLSFMFQNLLIEGAYVYQGGFLCDFSISSANNIDYYIMVNDTIQNPYGYMLKTNAVNKTIDLCFVDSLYQEQLIISGPLGILNKSKGNKLFFKLTMFSSGECHLQMDTMEIKKESWCGTGYCLGLLKGYFGVAFNYTSTRADKLKLYPYRISLNECDIKKIYVKDMLNLGFTIELNSDNVIMYSKHVSDYSWDRGGRYFDLFLNKKLNPTKNNTIVIDSIDFGEKVCIYGFELNLNMSSYVNYHDIVFSEIMADPSPRVGLLEAEYIEIYNRTEDTLWLADVYFSDAHSTVCIGDAYDYIMPKSFLILTKDFEKDGIPVIPFNNFPSLNNDQDQISIRWKNVILDSLTYSVDWHDKDKQDGGWSLEKNNLDSYCNGAFDWESSADTKGGTPGFGLPNKKLYIQEIKPYELYTYKEKGEVKLFFEEAYDLPFIFSNWSQKHLHAQFDAVGNCLTIKCDECFGDIVFLDSLRDCENNWYSLELNPIRVDEILIGDIQLNELLFNPFPYGKDFVEIKNNSNKYLGIGSILIQNDKDEQVKLFKDNYVLKPREVIAITTDEIITSVQYPLFAADYNVIETDELITMPDDSGLVILRTDKLLLDSFFYRKEMHHELLRNSEGVSLQKLNNGLWVSSVESNGWATPGIPNDSVDNVGKNDGIHLSTNVIRPNLDGDKDELFIYFQIANPVFANVNILTEQGLLICQIANQKYIGNRDVLKWDGANNAKEKVKNGLYFIQFELYNTDGYYEVVNKTVGVWD